MAQIVEHPDGVHLHMSEDAYFADWALGSSSIKTLFSSPPDWWWESPFNLLQPQARKKKNALEFGSALHVALLEGMQTFRTVYGVEPTKYDHPNALDTMDDMKAWLKDRGEKVSGSKADLIERVLACDPNAPVLERIVAKWAQQGKRPISRTDFGKITLMERLLMGPPSQPTRLGKAFTGGLSEVSVFWTEEVQIGAAVVKIRFRARLDKLKPNASIDLKSFSNWEGREFHKAMLRDAAIRWYPLQAVHYEKARQKLREFVAAGKIFAPPGCEAEIELLQEIARAETWRWVWVFYKTDGAPRAKGIVMEWHGPGGMATEGQGKHGAIYNYALGQYQQAIAGFHQYAAHYGLGFNDDGSGKPMWVDLETLWDPAVEDFPSYSQIVD
jgi:hypothetical protein